jgi:hypothetical protein
MQSEFELLTYFTPLVINGENWLHDQKARKIIRMKKDGTIITYNYNQISDDFLICSRDSEKIEFEFNWETGIITVERDCVECSHKCKTQVKVIPDDQLPLMKIEVGGVYESNCGQTLYKDSNDTIRINQFYIDGIEIDNYWKILKEDSKGLTCIYSDSNYPLKMELKIEGNRFKGDIWKLCGNFEPIHCEDILIDPRSV